MRHGSLAGKLILVSKILLRFAPFLHLNCSNRNKQVWTYRLLIHHRNLPCFQWKEHCRIGFANKTVVGSASTLCNPTYTSTGPVEVWDRSAIWATREYRKKTIINFALHRCQIKNERLTPNAKLDYIFFIKYDFSGRNITKDDFYDHHH